MEDREKPAPPTTKDRSLADADCELARRAEEARARAIVGQPDPRRDRPEPSRRQRPDGPRRQEPQ